MKKIPTKHQPRGFRILHEDPDVIVGNKAPGYLTVAAKWESENTVHGALNRYVQKGNPRSRACVHVVHRLDQATSGVLIFAKTEDVQHYLKDNWKTTLKTYYAIVHGILEKKTGTIQSYLTQDEDYVIHSSAKDDGGKLAVTEYKVLKETGKFSLLEVNLLTGRKNQIRVHMADEGHPIVGDNKYGNPETKFRDLYLHSSTLEFTHPFRAKRMQFTAPVPAYFRNLVEYDYPTGRDH